MRTRRVGFRGRTSDFKRVSEALARAAAGVPFVLTIEGEAGIGKSRLIEEATQAATGVRVLRGKASELERERPFGPVLDALELRSHDVTGMVAAASSDVPSANQFAIADLLLDVVEDASAGGPLVLVVEDLHWADAATLALVVRLARQRGPLNTSLLCSRRPSPRSTNLEALLKSLSEAGGVELHLGRLDDDAVDDIVAELAGGRAGPALSARVRGAAGNPLYVIEFVEGLGGALVHHGGLADVPDRTAPPSLPLTILHRLGLLPAETIELLRLAAILGASFALRDLSAVARRSALELMPLLQPAVEAGVVVATTDGFRFRHDLIHEAAYADIPEPVRRVLHADAAVALSADPGADVAHVARHFELGTAGPDTAASDWLWNAAAATFPLDPNTGVELMARSVDCTPREHPARADRRVREVMNGANLGRERLDRARALLREPLPQLHRWVIEAALVTGLALAGQLDEAEQLAFATKRPRAAQTAIAMALAGARCFAADPDGADHVVAELLASVEGDEEDDARFLDQFAVARDGSVGIADFWLSVCHGLIAWTRGENDAGPEIARRWEAIARERTSPPQAMDCVTLILGADGSDDGWRASLHRIGTAASRAFPEIDAAAGFGFWLAGEWDEALTQFETSVQRAEASGPRVSDCLFAIAALIEAERGRTDVARTWLRRSQGVASNAGLGLWVEAVVAEVEGDADQARRRLAEAWHRDDQAGTRVWQRLYAADLVRHAIVAGDERLASEVVAVVEALQPRGGELAVAVATHCRALTEGNGARLKEAAERFRRLDRPVEAARAGEDAAAAFARSDRAQAQPLLDRATEVYASLGAQRDLARLARRLREAGLVRKVQPAPRPLTGWASLTRSELRVAELVSHGLTYRAIGERLSVSRRTVETHVAHVFVKLDVKSKAELASAYVVRFGA